MKSKFLLLLIMTVLILSLIFLIGSKPDIHSCTYNELINLHDIGPILATRIELYLEENPEASVEELVEVEGIGVQRLQTIKEEWSD